MYREKSTFLPVEYYNKLPYSCKISVGYILDPMIATANTAIAAVNILKDWGLTKIVFVSLLASKEGLEKLQEHHPDIQIVVGKVDDELNEKGYVVPGKLSMSILMRLTRQVWEIWAIVISTRNTSFHLVFYNLSLVDLEVLHQLCINRLNRIRHSWL